ncbi:DUF4350 domain-containing protein [Arcicella aquatica]|uniref:DUF4350 domain-containing protein n=1 Tax=Arcicella aquatica TaxID=217141 RepID=A0ABU5QLU4_9BACT|nr:DUF4350 domain-containing protein [Arcicella aquatica]MEA5258003.1 DUF4350 domain-containing protein [Arcicella aquatica]
MKKHRFYLLILSLTVLGFVLVEIYTPKPIDWTQTYSSKDKIPYGCELLYKLLPEVFRNQKISDGRVPIYAKGAANTINNTKSNYIYVYQYFRVDSINRKKLLDYVHQGNNAFIAAEDFYGLNDTLHFETNYSQTFTKDSVTINLVNPQLKAPKAFRYHHQSVNTYFELNYKKDSLTKIVATNAIILGKNHTGEANFIKIPFGKGSFYLSTVPKAFSNFYLLKANNADYAFKALSYLPERQVYWDEYVNVVGFGKNSRSILKSKYAKGEDDIDSSPFKFIASQPALKWAYYITLVSLLIYLIFEGKRRQRIIPIIEIPQNTSLSFVETIGALYYNQKDHKAISDKKIAYLLAYIRNKFHLKTTILDQEFKDDLSRKTNLPIAEINDLFDYVATMQSSEHVQEKDLVDFNKHIEAFYKNT